MIEKKEGVGIALRGRTDALAGSQGRGSVMCAFWVFGSPWREICQVSAGTKIHHSSSLSEIQCQAYRLLRWLYLGKNEVSLLLHVAEMSSSSDPAVEKEGEMVTGNHRL